MLKRVKEKVAFEELLEFKNHMAYTFIKNYPTMASAYYEGILDYDEEGKIRYPIEPKNFSDEELTEWN